MAIIAFLAFAIVVPTKAARLLEPDDEAGLSCGRRVSDCQPERGVSLSLIADLVNPTSFRTGEGTWVVAGVLVALVVGATFVFGRKH